VDLPVFPPPYAPQKKGIMRTMVKEQQQWEVWSPPKNSLPAPAHVSCFLEANGCSSLMGAFQRRLFLLCLEFFQRKETLPLILKQTLNPTHTQSLSFARI
jgi:hypothetical protein